jgi:hypothetical protein
LSVSAKRADGLRARLKRAGLFVAIVWGVASSFIAFEIVALQGVDLAFAFPGLFGDTIVSPATKASIACVVGPEESAGPAAPSPGLKPSEARASAWLLGLRVGQDGSVRHFPKVRTETLAELRAGVEQLASTLGVPTPAIFAPQQVANAPQEFVAFVDADTQGTARQLAVRFSPSACQLFKLGSVWGYSMLNRLAAPGSRAILAPQIRYHAVKLGLPQALWQPMVDRSPKGATVNQLEADMTAVTEGLTKFLLTQP